MPAGSFLFASMARIYTELGTCQAKLGNFRDKVGLSPLRSPRMVVNMTGTERLWKRRERAINEHFAQALAAELARARVSPAKAAPAAGFTQQQLSKWLSAAAGNEKGVMTAARIAAVCAANGIDASAVYRSGFENARNAGLLRPDWANGADGDELAARRERASRESEVDRLLGEGKFAAADANDYAEMDEQPDPNGHGGAT